MRSVARVRGIERLSTPELVKLVAVADQVGTDPDNLAAVISFESDGTFSPAKRNPSSGATGLIQIIAPTAALLGTSTAELARMTVARQLDFVRKYFEPYRGRVGTLERAYLAVFYPAAIDMGPDEVIASRGSKVYEQNAGFDSTNSGVIRRADVTRAIRGVLSAASFRPRVDVPGAPERWFENLAIVAAVGATAYLAWTERDRFERLWRDRARVAWLLPRLHVTT